MAVVILTWNTFLKQSFNSVLLMSAYFFFCTTDVAIKSIKQNAFACHWPNQRKKGSSPHQPFQHCRILTCILWFVEFFSSQMPVWKLFKCRKAACWLNRVQFPPELCESKPPFHIPVADSSNIVSVQPKISPKWFEDHSRSLNAC